MAEDACKDLEMLLDSTSRQGRIQMYHNHRDGEQYPPTAVLLAMRCLVPFTAATYNRAGSRWIVWTTGCAIFPAGGQDARVDG